MSNTLFKKIVMEKYSVKSPSLFKIFYHKRVPTILIIIMYAGFDKGSVSFRGEMDEDVIIARMHQQRGERTNSS